MSYYFQNIPEVAEHLKTHAEGLSSEEAQARLELNGKNRLIDAKKNSLLRQFFLQLKDPMIIMLICAAGISAMTALYSGESLTDVFIIISVVILNAVLGLVQESKAERAIEALKEMSAATSKVLRNGSVTVIPSEDIVVGDIIILGEGDSVPADGRVIEAAALKTEEAPLTGESMPVSKFIDALSLRDGQTDIPLGDRKNMAYMGSSISYGRGRMLVTATGMQTEMGKIADAIANTTEGATPLQRKLAKLGKTLSFAVLVISAIVFVVLTATTGDFTFTSILKTFMIAVALAVAAIPEGLPAVVTIVLSIGVTKMSRRSAIIRKLMAVESLGSTQIICSDKTGTLTQNKMTVIEASTDDKVLLASAMALCNDAKIEGGREVGDPTETALIVYAAKFDLIKNDLDEQFPRVGEAPFDSVRKMMSTVHSSDGNKIVQYTKGAPDIIISHCSRYIENGTVHEMTEEKRTEFLNANIDYADRALRVLAAAYRDYEQMPSSFESDVLEQDLIYIGLTGMIDPARPEVRDAIVRCREAGVVPIMITGDHLNTATAIAIHLGIISDKTQAITGESLDGMSDKELEELVTRVSVYARVQPEHKVRIVKAWQRLHKVTAMTGDGVNDAPSIKAADIGIGMGITGTDVTKNVADMVLADDNFATIVTAIEEGRKIYDNIRKVLLFQMSTNLAEVLLVFISSLMGFHIFETAHLLWINMVTDTAPGLALGTEQAEADIMSKPPRPSNESIFKGFVDDIAMQGICLTIIVLIAYFIGPFVETGVWRFTISADGQTMAFLTLSLAETFHSLNMRSQRKSLFALKYHNYYLYGAIAFSLVMTGIVVFVPFLAEAFGFARISILKYAVSLGLSLCVIPLVEVTKVIQRKLGW